MARDGSASEVELCGDGVGVTRAGERLPDIHGPNGKPSLWLHETTNKPVPLHLAFTAETRAQVDAFYRAALDAGGRDNGAPGLRQHYHANYYGAFVIGPDGHNVEAVCHRADA